VKYSDSAARSENVGQSWTKLDKECSDGCLQETVQIKTRI